MLARLISLRLVHIIAGVVAAALLAIGAPARAADEKKEEEAEPAEDKPDPKQPPVYAGGLYTLATFPLKEYDRTLTLTEGVIEVRPDLAIDMSKGQTFKTWDLRLLGRYGVRDTLEIQGGVSQLQLAAPEGVDKRIGLFAAAEVALMYDLIDFRAGVDVPVSPDFLLDIFAGLPVKLRIQEKVAILAFDKILTVHTMKPEGVKDTPKPDLTIGVGGLVQVLDQLAIIVRATVILKEFETDEAHRALPLELDVQYTVSNVFDIGLGFAFLNFLAKSTETDPTGMVTSKSIPVDQRALFLFARFRLGR